MRYLVQFLLPSTGYIPGTIPPQFGKPELTDATGDTGVFILDGRNSEATMHRDARRRAQRLAHWRQYPAYQLVKGPRLFQESTRGRVVRLSYPIATD